MAKIIQNNVTKKIYFVFFFFEIFLRDVKKREKRIQIYKII